MAGTLLLMFTAASTSALAQFGDAGASDLVQKAKQALLDRRADVERLLRQALAVPGQTQIGYGDTAIALSAFLVGEQRPASEIRPLTQKAAQLYSEAAAEEGGTALALELLASVRDPAADPGELRPRLFARKHCGPRSLKPCRHRHEQFEPALLNGVPVPVIANVELKFRLL